MQKTFAPSGLCLQSAMLCTRARVFTSMNARSVRTRLRTRKIAGIIWSSLSEFCVPIVILRTTNRTSGFWETETERERETGSLEISNERGKSAARARSRAEYGTYLGCIWYIKFYIHTHIYVFTQGGAIGALTSARFVCAAWILYLILDSSYLIATIREGSSCLIPRASWVDSSPFALPLFLLAFASPSTCLSHFQSVVPLRDKCLFNFHLAWRLRFKRDAHNCLPAFCLAEIFKGFEETRSRSPRLGLII